MPNFKIVVSDPKTRKGYQKEVDHGQSGLIGKKVGERISGNSIGLQGYELEITGGSDKQGFPMRGDVEGTARKKILLAFPPGFHPKIKGQRKRKSIRGNTISTQVVQVNTKVTKYGPKSLDELIGTKPKPKEEKEKPEAKPEEKAEQEAEKPEKEKKEVKPEEKPKEKEPGKAEAEEKKPEEKQKGPEQKKEKK